MLKPAAELFGKTIRGIGASIEAGGLAIEGRKATKAVPCSKVLTYMGKSPSLAENVFIAQTANVMGDVTIGPGSNVWYGAVIRGDVNSIKIGNSVSIGDAVMVHCSGLQKNAKTNIGNNVVLGPGSLVHGGKLGDGCVVGANAQILDNASIGAGSALAPCAVLLEGATIPPGQLWGGAPAKYLRDVTSADVAAMAAVYSTSEEVTALHIKQASKTWQEEEEDAFNFAQQRDRNEFYFKTLTEEQMTFKEGEVEGHLVPGRLFDSKISVRQDKDYRPTD